MKIIQNKSCLLVWGDNTKRFCSDVRSKLHRIVIVNYIKNPAEQDLQGHISRPFQGHGANEIKSPIFHKILAIGC